jgi:hypothetical protein
MRWVVVARIQMSNLARGVFQGLLYIVLPKPMALPLVPLGGFCFCEKLESPHDPAPRKTWFAMSLAPTANSFMRGRKNAPAVVAAYIRTGDTF